MGTLHIHPSLPSLPSLHHFHQCLVSSYCHFHSKNVFSSLRLSPLHLHLFNDNNNNITRFITNTALSDHEQVMASDEIQNNGAFEENAALPKVEVPLDTGNSVAVDQELEPKPVEDIAPGIAPVADFIPKDAPTSHPTPPPDEPLVNSEANVDVEMANSDALKEGADLAPAVTEAPAPSQPSEPTPVRPVPESSLVRPREDDGEDDEPAAKRSKIDGESSQEGIAAEMSAVALTNGTQTGPTQQQPAVVAGADGPELQMSEAKPEAGPSGEKPADARNAVPDSGADPGMAPVSDGVLPAASTNLDPTAEASVSQPASTDAKHISDAPQNSAQPASANVAPQSVPAPAATATYSTSPMTALQKTFLQDKMKNLKKTKNSAAFLNPVDHVALNIPSYPEIIKHPMDLNSMEQKLKSGKYATVQEFADDFNLIINNTRTFNGPAHAVTQAGLNMEAYFKKMMDSVPSASWAAPQRTQQPKKASPKPAPAPRREARAAPPPASTEPFALQSDGVPQIRRESTANRPARAIKPPPAKELTYAKPKRKEHQLELKFCDWVLNEIRGPKYAHANSVFLAPVDPVALNIPHYRQVIKHPMDLGTMVQKLKQGQYAKASEVKKDFELMIQNCLVFNPTGNVVRDMGISLQREFESLWRNKDKWEKNARSNQPGNSSADDDESADDDDEEEEEGGADNASQTIAALQKQLMDMQNALAGLNKAPKAKKTKSAKPSHKKGGGAPAPKHKAAPAKAKSKKAKVVSYEEKQEISEAVGNMSGPQVEELTRIITSNCKKYAEQEEMELEIDDLPNDVQAMLLEYVRSIFGHPNKAARGASPDELVDEDDEFEPERSNKRGNGGGGAKRKKHKPMGKEEQQMAIDNIQKQLAQFSGGAGAMPATNGYAGAGQGAGETSGDDESEESEEE
jgi:bromodomain-containing factor 1